MTYPEHEKLRFISDQSQACGEFLDWLSSRGVTLGKYEEVTAACWNCDHEDSHREKADSGWDLWVCEHEGCKCDDVYHGNPERMRWYPKPVQELLAEFFNIDRSKIETEKCQMLDEIRAANVAQEATGT